MEGVTLDIEARSFATPLEVAPDHSFTLPRNTAALKENAQVMPNRKAGTMRAGPRRSSRRRAVGRLYRPSPRRI